MGRWDKTQWSDFQEKCASLAEEECWIWDGYTICGYGYVSQSLTPKEPINHYVHRLMYQERVGPIPDGLFLDHLCRNKRCANPKHLEPVTPAENVRRGWLFRPRAFVCKNGHQMTDTNVAYINRKTRIERVCKECISARNSRHYYKRAAF